MTPTDLTSLAAEVERAEGPDNALDVRVECALFSPKGSEVSILANAAGSKIIIKHRNGSVSVHWADDWTKDRPTTARKLRARAAIMEASHGA